MKPTDIRLDDERAEQVRRSHAAAIKALQDATPRVVSGVQLKNGIATTVAHSLGRAPRIVIVGVPRGAVSAGYITDDAKKDRSSSVTLTATGYGATITVDVEFA